MQPSRRRTSPAPKRLGRLAAAAVCATALLTGGAGAAFADTGSAPAPRLGVLAGPEQVVLTAEQHSGSFAVHNPGNVTETITAVEAGRGASWLSLSPATFTLAPGATRRVEFTVTLPADATPGDHPVRIDVAATMAEAGPGAVRSRVLSPVTVVVPVVGTPAATLSTSLQAPGLITSTSGDVTFTPRISNDGTMLAQWQPGAAGPEAAQPVLRLTSPSPLLGGDRVLSSGSDGQAPDALTVLPGRSATQTFVLRDAPLLGWYDYTYTLPAAPGHPTVATSGHVVVVNLLAWARVALVGLGLAFAVAFLRPRSRTAREARVAVGTRPVAPRRARGLALAWRRLVSPLGSSHGTRFAGRWGGGRRFAPRTRHLTLAPLTAQGTNGSRPRRPRHAVRPRLPLAQARFAVTCALVVTLVTVPLSLATGRAMAETLAPTATPAAASPVPTDATSPTATPPAVTSTPTPETATTPAASPNPSADPSGPVPSSSASATAAGSKVGLIVRFRSGVTAATQAATLASHGGSESAAFPALGIRVVQVPSGQANTAKAAYKADRNVLSVEQDQLRTASATPSDPGYGSQWNLPQIRWDAARDTITPTGTATIAVLDTGIAAAHPDLSGLVTGGWSAFGTDPLSDPNGHGTAMAGIAAARTDNATGIAGTAYAGARLQSVQVLDAHGQGTDSDIIEGVLWAADHGASVILMAFSNPGYSSALQAAITYAWSKGAVLVAATGNQGTTAPTYPAGDAHVMGITATDASNTLALASNHGPDTFLAAPGISVPALGVDGGVTNVSGTSAAAAQIAGAAAVLRAVDATASNGVIVGRLARTADKSGASNLGNGLLDLGAAVTDVSTGSIDPVGASAGGGPVVGPYQAAVVAKLAVTSVPSNATADSAFSVTVQAQDSGGTPENVAANTEVTLTLNSGTGTLGGTLTADIVSGQNSVTFTNVIYRKAEDITLKASASGLTDGVSGSFTVAAGAAHHVVFASGDSPVTTAFGSSLTRDGTEAPRVSIVDAYGNLTASTASVTVAKTTGTPTAGSGTLSGTTTQNAVAGVASFPDLKVEGIGTGFKLTASSSGLVPADSAAFGSTGTSITGPSTLDLGSAPRDAEVWSTATKGATNTVEWASYETSNKRIVAQLTTPFTNATSQTIASSNATLYTRSNGTDTSVGTLGSQQTVKALSTGSYGTGDQQFRIRLLIPNNAPLGAYTGTLTFSVAAAS